MKDLSAFWGKLVSFLTGEWILTRGGFPNGGGVVVARSLWTSLLLYLFALVWRETLLVIGPVKRLDPSLREVVVVLTETIRWFGVLFAATFTSFYTRFSQQWTYLANLYNQIKATQVRSAGNPEAEQPLDEWRAGFIEDAINLHLAAKPLFLSIIRRWYERPRVAEEIRNHTDIETRVKALLKIESGPSGQGEPNNEMSN